MEVVSAQCAEGRPEVAARFANIVVVDDVSGSAATMEIDAVGGIGDRPEEAPLATHAPAIAKPEGRPGKKLEHNEETKRFELRRCKDGISMVIGKEEFEINKKDDEDSSRRTGETRSQLLAGRWPEVPKAAPRTQQDALSLKMQIEVEAARSKKTWPWGGGGGGARRCTPTTSAQMQVLVGRWAANSMHRVYGGFGLLSHNCFRLPW